PVLYSMLTMFFIVSVAVSAYLSSLSLHDALPISALVPAVLSVVRRQEWLVIAFSVALALGYAGLIVIPTAVPWLLALLIGFGLRSEEHTSELQSRFDLVCRLLLEKKK